MSLSLLDTLHQSRIHLTQHAFPPFPSSTPHTLTPLSDPSSSSSSSPTPLTLSIGPHFFRVRFWSCHWRALPPPSHPDSQSTGSTGPSTSSSNPDEISPAIISRLNHLAQSDADLASLLRKAGSGTAEPQELEGLGRFIEGLKRGDPELGGVAERGLEAGSGSGGEVGWAERVEGGVRSLVFEFVEGQDEEESRGQSEKEEVETEGEKQPKKKQRRKWLLPQHLYYTPLLPNTVPSAFPLSPPPSRPPLAANLSNDDPDLPQPVLLSLFLFPSTSPTLSTRYRARLASTTFDPSTAAALGLTPEDAPVPVDLVLHACGKEVREAVWAAARNSRGKVEGCEKWWREMINAVPSRLHLDFNPLPSSTSTTLQAEFDPDLNATAGSPDLSRRPSEQPLAGAAVASGTGNKRGGTPQAGGPPAKKARGGKKPSATPLLAHSPSLGPGATPFVVASPSPSLGTGAVGSPVPSEPPHPQTAPAPRARKKPGPKPGSKRGGGAGVTSGPRPKGKPGPKPKNKVKAEEGDADVEGGHGVQVQVPVERRTSGRVRKSRGSFKEEDSEDEFEREREGERGDGGEYRG
ncbi:hypothetical protein JCM11641_004400 [Rhodosporidiobolus odoratus]